MDFIERIFNLSPDGGSGTLEAMLVFLPVIMFAGCLAVRRRSLLRTALNPSYPPVLHYEETASK